MNARRPFALLVLVGTLFASAEGALAQSTAYPLPTPPPGAQGPPGAGADARRSGPLRRALVQLGLSRAQRGQIRSMVRSFRASRASATPMTRKQLLATIESVLTAAQKTQFEGLMRGHAPRAAQPA